MCGIDTCSSEYELAHEVGGGAFYIAALLGDGEAAAPEVAEEIADAEGVNKVASVARSTPGNDGAESVIIKERTPDGATVLVEHQVGKPLPGGGTIVIHQHAKFGPLPGSELFFPDVNP